MLELGLANPRYSASLMLLRSIARLAARRTRRSAHGERGSHCSTNVIHSVNVGDVAFSVSPDVRLISSASAPLSEYAMSASPRFSIARRVASSGTERSTRRFTLGVFRQ